MSAAVEYLRRAIEDSRVVELRHERDGRWGSGLYDDLGELIAEIRRRQDTGNLYTTLNLPVATATNSMRGPALRDEHIQTITRIVFDVDPARPAGEPATDGECAAAAAGRDLLVRALTAHGWPVPGLGMSGNGAHALYRTRLLSNDGWRQCSALLYAALRKHLHTQFAELGVSLDTTVRNPARVWRLYGTINRKGVSSPERPHRRSRVYLPAGPWQVVRAEVVNRTIDSLGPAVVPEPPPARPRPPFQGARGDLRTLDIAALFRAKGLYRRQIAGGKHSITCPWSAAHTTGRPEDTSTVVWEAGGRQWPTFFCSHQHCEDRKITDVLGLWPEHEQFCAQRWGGP